MKTLTLTAGLLGSILLTGCVRENPTAPATDFAAAVNSGCQAVRFTTLFTAISDFVYTGIVTGDLQGTADLVADEVGPFRGVTILVGADITWHITGGIIPGLIGETFVTRLTQHNIFLPGTSLVKNVGELRAISGVENANVTFNALTSLDTDPQQTSLDLKGVICP